MEVRIAVTDDDQNDLARVTEGIRSFFADRRDSTAQISSFSSAESLLEVFEPGSFDLVFLDILMGGMNGVSCANRLREADKKLTLVFLTSSGEYALDAYAAHPYDYLIKPVDMGRLHRLLEEILHMLGKKEAEISLKTRNGVLSIPIGSISAVLSQGHTTEIVLSERQKLQSPQTFREVSEALLKDPRFLPCNRGILVNMEHAESMPGDVIRMKDGGVYPLRVKQRRELVSQFSQYMVYMMSKGMTV